MPNSATLRTAPSSTLLGRLMVTLDQLLLAYAEAEIRNGDVPRCGI